jgi:NAD(P)-dependent dehydrogenase (short-subunit alcohol dehydrogenase family)
MAASAECGRLLGKVVFITGAAQGIGKASALKCVSEGARVIATDVNTEKLQELEREQPAIVTDTLNVTCREDVEHLLRVKYSDVNVLFNCAGYVFHGTLLDTEEKDWDHTFDLNVKSMFYTSKTCVGMWKERGVRGNIINMSSAASSIKGAVFRCIYGASKAAVIGLTKSIAADFVKDGIRCNAICPGTIDTPSLNDRMRAAGDYETARANFIARQKMGRLGTAEEIASLVVYLASDESAFVTGETVVIDGGWTL